MPSEHKRKKNITPDKSSNIPTFKQNKGEKTRKALAGFYAHRLGIPVDNIDESTIEQLQEEDQKNQVEDLDTDIWQELILEYKAQLRQKEIINDTNLADMAVQLKAITVQKTAKSIDQQSVYFNPNDLRAFLSAKRKDNNEIDQDDGNSFQKCCIRCGPPFPFDNRWRRFWDYFVIIVAIYSTFTIPISFAFEPPSFEETWYIVTDWFTTFVYFLDVIVQFRTTIVDQHGIIISQYSTIATNYVYSINFYIDTISLLANPSTDHIYWVKFVGLLKIVRVFRIRKLITEANAGRQQKAYFKGLFYTFLLTVYIHLTACIWFFVLAHSKNFLKTHGFTISELEKEWVPPFWFNSYTSSTFWTGGQIQQYWTCVYYCVLVLGGNELGPSNQVEQLYIVCINLVGALVNAQIFGELAVILSQLNRQSAEFQGVIDTANTAMGNISLPHELRKKIRSYFYKVQTTQAQQNELDQFLDQISPSLVLKVQSQLFSTIIKEKNSVITNVIVSIIKKDKNNDINLNPAAVKSVDDLFQDLGVQESLAAQKKGPSAVLNSALQIGKKEEKSSSNEEEHSSARRIFDFIPLLVSKLGTSLNMPEEKVIKQDEDGSRVDLYIIGKGDCEVQVRDERGRVHENVRQLVEGDHFGEVALLYGCKRTATVISRNYNTLANMEQSRFRELIAEYPEYEAQLKVHLIKTYDGPKITFLKTMIQRVDYFKNLDDEILYELIFSLKSKTYEAGSILLAEGEHANSIQFVENGSLQIQTTFEGNKFVIETLHRGSAINYQSVFSQEKMNVDMECVTNVRILEMTWDKLTQLQTKYKDQGFNKKILQYQQKILLNDRKFPLDYILCGPKQKSEAAVEADAREFKLKSVIMRIILEIRERKRRPKLSDFMGLYRKKKHLPNAKEDFQKKFLLLYGGEDAGDEKDEDSKFDNLMSTIDRCQKQLLQQQNATTALIKRTNNLIERRDKKETIREQELEGRSSSDSGEQSPRISIVKKSTTQPKNSKQNIQQDPNFIESTIKQKKDKKDEGSGDDSEGEKREKERIRIEKETSLIEERYLNANSPQNSQNIEMLAKLAPKPKTDPLGIMRSAYLKQDKIAFDEDVEYYDEEYGSQEGDSQANAADDEGLNEQNSKIEESSVNMESNADLLAGQDLIFNNKKNKDEPEGLIPLKVKKK